MLLAAQVGWGCYVDKFDYNKARQTAERLINKFGAECSAVQEAVGGGTDAFGDPLPGTDAVTIDGIITPKLNYRVSEVDGSVVQHGDCYVYFHSNTAPSIDMTVTLNGETFRIVDIVDLTSVDGINVYRKLQLRR